LHRAFDHRLDTAPTLPWKRVCDTREVRSCDKRSNENFFYFFFFDVGRKGTDPAPLWKKRAALQKRSIENRIAFVRPPQRVEGKTEAGLAPAPCRGIGFDHPSCQRIEHHERRDGWPSPPLRQARTTVGASEDMDDPRSVRSGAKAAAGKAGAGSFTRRGGGDNIAKREPTRCGFRPAG